jgi:hypothetical protein
MSESKPVVWFADNRKPNNFFFRSPFRSWNLLINAGLATVVSLAFAWTLWKYWDRLDGGSGRWMFLVALFTQNVVYAFWWALKRHRKINELYVAGYITEQATGSPLDEVLEVADNAINDGLRNTVVLFGLLLLTYVLWKLA